MYEMRFNTALTEKKISLEWIISSLSVSTRGKKCKFKSESKTSASIILLI